MTSGSDAGEPMVLVLPASPELTTTVTPAATAASLASRVTSSAVSGKFVEAKDSLMTLAPLATAKLIASRKPDSVVSLFVANTFSASTLAPGATPTILMSQPLGNGCVGDTYWERS